MTKTKLKTNKVTGKKKVEKEKPPARATFENPIRLDEEQTVPPKAYPELGNVHYVHIWSKADMRHYHRYGMCTVPMGEQWADGSKWDTGQYLDILNKYKDEKGKVSIRSVGRLMSREYALIPHELLIDEVSRQGFDPDTADIRYSRGGNRMYMSILSKKKDFRDVKVKVGDTIQVGCMIRNSIDGSMSVGIDGFTYRLGCKNGAVMRGDDSISSTFIHHGKGVLENVLAAIDQVMRYVRDKTQIYKLATEVKVTKPLAMQFFDIHTVPERYTPDWIEPKYQIDEKTKLRDMIDMKLTDQNKTFWDLFNELTENYWHKMGEHKLGIENTFNKEITLHDALETVVLYPNPNYGIHNFKVRQYG